jgi:CheY-like chemotaxis protein
MMPDLDGLELCRRVRAQSRPDYTYIILLTSRSGKTNYLEAMNAGADDFVTKPFEPDELAARIRVAERILTLQANLRAVNLDLERRVQERTAEASQALRAKSEFLSRASHELRTPMHHILGFGQLLAMNPTSPHNQESVERILASGDHMMKLIDRLLSISSAHPDELKFLETAGAPQPSSSGSNPAEQG